MQPATTSPDTLWKVRFLADRSFDHASYRAGEEREFVPLVAAREVMAGQALPVLAPLPSLTAIGHHPAGVSKALELLIGADSVSPTFDVEGAAQTLSTLRSTTRSEWLLEHEPRALPHEKLRFIGTSPREELQTVTFHERGELQVQIVAEAICRFRLAQLVELLVVALRKGEVIMRGFPSGKFDEKEPLRVPARAIAKDFMIDLDKDTFLLGTRKRRAELLFEDVQVSLGSVPTSTKKVREAVEYLRSLFAHDNLDTPKSVFRERVEEKLKAAFGEDRWKEIWALAAVDQPERRKAGRKKVVGKRKSKSN